MESAILRNTKEELDLSEQQIIDCTYKIYGVWNDGCDGGYEFVVLDYIKANGVTTEHEYGYTSGRGCRRGLCKKRNNTVRHGKGIQMRSFFSRTEQNLARSLATYGPLIVSISGGNNDFRYYSEGIYANTSCSNETDHNVLLVGYGTDKERPYWLIKNSWGTSWGENGYGKLLRGVNICGIVSDFVYFAYL